jgi:hypothetical protein
MNDYTPRHATSQPRTYNPPKESRLLQFRQFGAKLMSIGPKGSGKRVSGKVNNAYVPGRYEGGTHREMGRFG